ncbi:RNA-directed DNA polymerase, eukaryota [Tanacetum coccineum]|uniref:RNA-directed DNA polymerase, eukaryota n=1 Tax=Tanacetum coccineum TaxID=301880 RepID=A0ABQ4ZNY4_9ASTR
MVNIYGPQDHVSKLALWNRLTDFNGSYIMFGDMNAVRNAQERFGTTLNSIEADHFNSFIDSTGLVDLPIGVFAASWIDQTYGSNNTQDVGKETKNRWLLEEFNSMRKDLKRDPLCLPTLITDSSYIQGN